MKTKQDEKLSQFIAQYGRACRAVEEFHAVLFDSAASEDLSEAWQRTRATVDDAVGRITVLTQRGASQTETPSSAAAGRLSLSLEQLGLNKQLALDLADYKRHPGKKLLPVAHAHGIKAGKLRRKIKAALGLLGVSRGRDLRLDMVKALKKYGHLSPEDIKGHW
jgi:hypothetical protein